jgi:DNA-binding beta-propeller fold protein YncE
LIAVGARQVLAVAVGDGSVWVVRAGGPDADRSQLVRIDPRTDKTVGEPIRVPGAVPLDLVAGNGVWVTDSGGALRSRPGSVTRVDAAARAVAGPPLRVGRRPSAIALGEGGAWVTNEDDGTLTPIAVGRPR